ncbi:MAG TPA: hypothetical protein VGJ00_01535 [Rhabdochlamydiaceae bacterium]|jgi:hypothetical protein
MSFDGEIDDLGQCDSLYADLYYNMSYPLARQALWNGRDVRVLSTEKRNPTFPNTTRFEPRMRHYEQLHLSDGEPNEWEFAAAEPFRHSNTELKPMEEWLAETGMMFQSNEARCMPCGVWKKWGKKVEQTGRKCKHAAKKTIKKTGHVVSDVGKYIDKHKTEIIIGTIIVVAVGVTCGLGAAGTAAVASVVAPEASPNAPAHGRRKKEEKDDETAGLDPEPPPRDAPSLAEFSARASPPQRVTENWVGDVVNSIARDLPTAAPEPVPEPKEQEDKPGFLKKMGGAVLQGLELVGRGAAGEPIDPQLQRHAALTEPESCIPIAPAEKERDPKELSKLAQAMPPRSRTPSETPINPALLPSITPPDRIVPSSSKNEKGGGIKKIEPPQPQVLNLYDKGQIAKIIPPDRSTVFKTAGEQRTDKCIVYINGMNTDFEDGCKNLEYLQSFVPDASITWVFNHSNGIVMDVVEIAALNCSGIAPVTGDLLKQVWLEFYEKNKDNPNAVLFHVCHSQGALLTRAALLESAPEVQRHIEILAVAPAAIISKNWCFESYNYACSSDIVPKLGMSYDILASQYRRNEMEQVEYLIENDKIRKELRILKANSKGMNHDFRNKIYQELIHKHINEYLHKQ